LLIVTKVLEHILNIFHFDDYTLMQACLKNSLFAGELLRVAVKMIVEKCKLPILL